MKNNDYRDTYEYNEKLIFYSTAVVGHRTFYTSQTVEKSVKVIVKVYDGMEV